MDFTQRLIAYQPDVVRVSPRVSMRGFGESPSPTDAESRARAGGIALGVVMGGLVGTGLGVALTLLFMPRR